MKEFFIRRYRSDAAGGDPRRTLIRVDDNGLVTYADAQAEAVLGYDAGALEGRPVTCLVAAREDDPFAPGNRQRMESGEAAQITLRHRDGYYFTAEVTLRLKVRDSDRAATAFISLRDQQPLDPRLLQPADSSGALGIWELDIPENQLTWSEGIYHMLELRPGAELTPEQALFYCQGSQNRLRALFRRCMRNGRPFSVTFEVVTARQRIRRLKLDGRLLHRGQPIVRLGGTITDLTGEMIQRQARSHTRQLLQATIGATDNLVAAVDRKLNLVCCNRPFQEQFALSFGITPVEGDNLSTLLASFPNERRLTERLWARAFERDSFIVEMPIAQHNNQLPVFEFHFQPLKSEQGEVTGAVHVAKDITDRLRAAGTSHFRNRHDPVTGLLNRREFIHRLNRVLGRPVTESNSHGLLYLDLDDFARFNDLCGNGSCDRYLRALASVLGVRVRQRDALARLSGDTFALLLENCNEGQARRVADNLLALTREFVFEWQGRQLATTASAGLLMIHEDSPRDGEQLIGQAADLCHTAKIAGRNRVHTSHSGTDNDSERRVRRLLELIQQSLDNDTLILEFETLRPVASATWGDHVEILARIGSDDPQEPALKPADFLPVAERFDLAKLIDRQVIRKTLGWLASQPLMEPRLKYCGFNLSLASVLDDSFPDFVETLLKELPFAAESFCFEIREADASQYPDDVAILCDGLHRIGCRIALDGAGASVASYSLAARLPVDIIKLDGGMIRGLENDPVQLVMTETLQRIAVAAGKATVATYIENDDTLRKVRTLGIHYGQGHRLSRPRPLTELTAASVPLECGPAGT